LRLFHAPGMYVHEHTFDAVAAFLNGFDTACGGRVLAGFREWLILKLDYGNNLAWTELFLRFAFPESAGPRTQELPTADQKQLVGLLGETFLTYWIEREGSDGLQTLMQRHTEWLRGQDWYQEAM
jgi:hypothetical protein